MQHIWWDHGLKVTGDGAGLAGHGGGVLLRKLAGQCGLTAVDSDRLERTPSIRQLTRALQAPPCTP